MKKTTILFLVLVLLLALSACGKQTGDSVGNETTETQHPSKDAAQAKQDVASGISETRKDESVQTPKNQEEEFISRENAIDIALQKAGLTRGSVYDLDAELDRERNGTFWEVDFETRDREYSYEIDAITGNIVRQEPE